MAVKTSTKSRTSHSTPVFPSERELAREVGLTSQDQKLVSQVRRKRKPNAAFEKIVRPSRALAVVVGDKALPRTEVTREVWDYVKRNKLMDTKNRRMINADDKLKTVFGGRKRVSMFELTKLVSKHLK